MKATIHFDGLISQNLTGWASAGNLDESEPAEAVRLPVTLRIGGEVVALSPRRLQHVKAGIELGPATVLRGFAIPFIPAMVYTALLGRGSLAELTISFQDKAVTAQNLAPGLRDIGAYRSLLFREHAKIRISDLWFTTGNQLRLRIHVADTTELDSLNLNFYQSDERRNTVATLIARHRIGRHGINFISVDLLNPFLPLLLTLSDADNNIQLIDVLPYPSLCQGGKHFAELRALGTTGRYIDDLRAVSDSLVREHLGWAGAPARSIGRIAVKIDQAGGSEAIFSDDVRNWINRLFGAAIVVDHSDTENVADPELERHLIGEAANVSTSEEERLTLNIPADSLPTISGLVARRLRLSPGMTQMSGPFVAADLHNGAPRWLVSMPPLPAWLSGLQPRSSVRFYPVVSRGTEMTQESGLAPLPADVPLAIKFIPPVELNESNRIFPIARDVDGGVLRSSAARAANQGLVSVVVSTSDGHLTDLANLTNSLATQSLRETLEIIVVSNRAPAHFREAAARLLGEAFAGRFQIVDYDDAFNRSAQVNLGADHAKGDFVIIAGDDVVLMDPRTIETLLTLADNREVASSSCLLVQEKSESDSTLSFHSAGLFPSELSLVGRPFMSFGEIDCESLLANATYPVVANSLAFCAVRTDNWRTLGGLDATLFPNDNNDVDYGLRALAKGLIHLCTTGVAAHHSRRASRALIRDTHSTRYLTHLPLDRLLGLCTVVRKLDG